MRAQDLLPDGVDQAEFDGVSVRKGSVGAFLANARTLTDPTTTNEARLAAEHDMFPPAVSLRTFGSGGASAECGVPTGDEVRDLSRANFRSLSGGAGNSMAGVDGIHGGAD